MILRCTTKLLKVLRVSPSSLVEIQTRADDDEWYANLLWFARRKCLLLTHAETLFSIFVPEILKADITPPGPFIVAAIEHALAMEDLPRDTFGRLDRGDVRLGRTTSRTILGCMNELAKFVEYDVIHQSQTAAVDVAALNHQLHRTILGPLGLRYPIDLAAERALRLRGMSTN